MANVDSDHRSRRASFIQQIVTKSSTEQRAQFVASHISGITQRFNQLTKPNEKGGTSKSIIGLALWPC